jgi:hypothetical protein
MEPDDLLCSRNARPEKALVGRAQWKINQPPSLKRERRLTSDPTTLAIRAFPASPARLAIISPRCSFSSSLSN